jgi:hypothetical protein
MRYLILAAVLCSGCATGLSAVDKALPSVAQGLHEVSSTSQALLGTICLRRARACQANGVADKLRCPGWLECDSVRESLEAVTRAAEDDVAGLKSKLAAYRKIEAAIQRMRSE